MPDLADPAVNAYSPLCRLVLELLLDLDARPERLPEARLALAQWAKTTRPLRGFVNLQLP
jgi:hypothetical protein